MLIKRMRGEDESGEYGRGSGLSATGVRQLLIARTVCTAGGFSRAELVELEHMVERTPPLQAQAHLFRHGDSFSALYAVRAGCFKTYVTDCEGSEHILGFHLPGELLGVDGIHSGIHQCSAQALDTASVCRLDFADLSRIATRMPILHEQLLRLVSREVSHFGLRVGDYRAEERLAAFLIDLAARYHRRGVSGREFMLAMSRQEIANYLQLAPETISRLFTRFEQAGWLQVNRRQVKLIEPAALAEQAKRVYQLA